MDPIQAAAERVVANIRKVIVGKPEVAELVLVALLCEGHVLLEDVPGVGKTMLAKTVARSLGSTFHRLQFTPDLLPSDVTGLHIFNQKAQEFEFRPGPIFAQVVLADEINRATPRTQSALLECMEERQVTLEGETRPLPRPFLVLATQNPIELEGTFPLPEAQLDRFMLKLSIGYPSAEEERSLLQRFGAASPLDDLAPVLQPEELTHLQGLSRGVYVSPAVEEYVVAIVRATRQHPLVRLGASPRGTLALHRGAQALAAIRGRAFVKPDDVKYLAAPVLAHRLICSAEATLRGRTAESIVGEAVASVPVPVESDGTTSAPADSPTPAPAPGPGPAPVPAPVPSSVATGAPGHS